MGPKFLLLSSEVECYFLSVNCSIVQVKIRVWVRTRARLVLGGRVIFESARYMWLFGEVHKESFTAYRYILPYYN